MAAESRRPETGTTSESRGVIEQCSRLAEGFASRAEQYDRQAAFPVQNFADLEDAGMLAIMVPQEVGGLGASFLTYTRALEQLAMGDASTGLMFNMHNIVIGSLAELDSGRIAKEWGGAVREFRDWAFEQARLGKIFAAATSEPGIGAHFSKLETSYRRVEGGFVIDGVKSFVSMAGHADYYVVAARSADSRSDTPALSFLVVERDNPGVRIEGVWDTLGMRATVSNDLHFTDCFVPENRLFLGIEGMVLFKVTREPHWLVGGYNGVYLGICSAAFRFLKVYLGSKKIPGTETPACESDWVQRRVGELYVALEAARAVTYDAARRVDEARGSLETNMAIHRAKYMVGELAPWLTSQAIRLCGGSTIARRLPLERLYRDARCGGLMPATSDECLFYVGKAALGLDVRRPDDTYW